MFDLKSVTRGPLRAVWLGQVDYQEAHALQKRLVEERTRDVITDTVLLLEHPAVITLGRAAKPANIVASEETLAAEGVSVEAVGRGGDVTYHGPGQLVMYPIVDLKPDRRDVRKYVQVLEETMIRLAAGFGITAERFDGFNGTWVEPETRPRKIGAVGVRISRWVTMHGLAFNLRPNLDHFKLIVPCGLVGKGVTSVLAERGESPSSEACAQQAADHFAASFGVSDLVFETRRHV